MAMARKIRKGDRVKVIAGKDKGKTGKVLRVDPRSDKVFVEGAQHQKRHQQPRTLRDTQRGGQVGGIIETRGPDPHLERDAARPEDERADPRRHRARREGRRVRVAKRSGKDID